MNELQAESVARHWRSEFGVVCCGRIVSIDDAGRPWVDFHGNPCEPVVARRVRTVVFEPREPLDDLEVLLVFEHGDPALPVIIGIVESTLALPREMTGALASPEAPREVTLDGRQVLLNGDEEVKLVCGKSSITLTQDGRISLRGIEIVSYAAGANKIRGASVAIN